MNFKLEGRVGWMVRVLEGRVNWMDLILEGWVGWIIWILEGWVGWMDRLLYLVWLVGVQRIAFMRVGSIASTC